MTWARLHWIVGVATLIGFLAAGLYMRDVIDVSAMPDAPRMIYRSRFLFLMLAGVLNLALSRKQATHWAERVASVVVLLAPLPLAASFLGDAERGVRSSPWTVWTMRGLFAAGLMFAFASFPWRGRKRD